MDNHPERVKALRWYGVDDMRVDMVAVRQPQRGEILVRNLFTGICGTDRHALSHGTFIDKKSDLNYPAILGHEGCSEILALGPDVEFDAAGQHIKPGDMVAYQDILGCGECRFCRQGSFNVCINLKQSGLKPGHFVQYFTYPSRLFVRIDGIDPKQGSLVEPAAVALHGTRISGLQVGDSVLVIGAGPIALLRIQHLKNLGAGRIIVAEPTEKRRALAKEFGADVVIDPQTQDVLTITRDITDGYGVDIAFEDAGLPELQRLAIDAVRPHGTVVITGITVNPLTINLVDKVMLHELTIKGSCGYSMWWDRTHDYVVVADMMRSGRLRTDSMISHVFPMDEFEKAFEMAGNSAESIKVTLDLA
jgi:2-desacetyl-2-hydroxyethyl bacteriochlorophyllide A dehydrogenase